MRRRKKNDTLEIGSDVIAPHVCLTQIGGGGGRSHLCDVTYRDSIFILAVNKLVFVINRMVLFFGCRS